VGEGDVVEVHFECRQPEEGKPGMLLESSYGGDPLKFEIGAGDVMDNELFQGFDGALRGLAVGDVAEVSVSGEEWNPELLFEVPLEHPEIERLERRYKSQGGVQEGAVVELQNGGKAYVLEKNDATVKLDANSEFAGKNLIFCLELMSVDDQSEG